MPYLGSTLFVATLVCFLLVSLVGSVLFAGALFGRATARAAELTARHPLRSIVAGLPIVVIGSVFGAGALQGGAGAKVLGALVTASLISVMLCGLAAISLVVGSRMWSRADDAQPYRRVLRGATVLVLASAFPIFGWLVVFPLAISAGVGGLLRALVARRALASGAVQAEAYAVR